MMVCLNCFKNSTVQYETTSSFEVKQKHLPCFSWSHEVCHVLLQQMLLGQKCQGLSDNNTKPLGNMKYCYCVKLLWHHALWFNRGTGSKQDIQRFLGLYIRFYWIVDKTKNTFVKSSKLQIRSRKQFNGEKLRKYTF